MAESFQEASPVALLILDDQGLIVRANKIAARLFRYAPGQLIGQHFSCLLPSSGDGNAGSSRQRAVRAALASSGCCTLHGCCGDGTSIAMQLRARGIEQDGRHWIVAHFRDLTAENQVKAALSRHIEQLLLTKESLLRHNMSLESVVEERTEQLRAAKDAADRANSAKSDFLANMSHELRTPLHGVLSFARFGVQRHESADRQKLLKYFSRIESTGQSLLRLLNDLLDLSKLEAGAMTLELEPVDLSVVIAGVAEEFSALAREKSLSLRLSGCEMPPQVWGDREKLAQVFRNLIGNAAKFTPEGGEIHVSWRDADGMAEIDLRDGGPGIPDSEREAIFDKFVQSHATKNGAGGTGLGLSICRQIVALHEGTITAEPVQGKGALIRVKLPRRTPDDPAPAESAEPSMACSN